MQSRFPIVVLAVLARGCHGCDVCSRALIAGGTVAGRRNRGTRQPGVGSLSAVLAILVCAGALLAADGNPAAARGPAAPAQPVAAGPLAGVPRGQILVVHVAEAARTMADIDALLKTIRRPESENPLWRLLPLFVFGRDFRFGPDSSFTFCVSPPAKLGGPTLRVAVLPRIDVAKVVGDTQPDAGGVYRRPDAPPAMVFADRTVVVGDAEALPAAAWAARGIEVTTAEREVLADADVLVRVDVPLILAQLEPRYQALRAELIRRAGEARREDAPAVKPAVLDEQLRALERLWAKAHEFTALTAGLIVNDRAVDVRVCLAVADGATVSDCLAGHPALVGELNPPLPRQEFAALAYAAFDAERLAKLFQWLLDGAVDATVVFSEAGPGLSPETLAALHQLFGDFGDLLGERAALVVPLASVREPVLQADGVVQLKDAARGAAWRGRVPAVLDALVYLAGAVLRHGADGAARATLESALDPASAGDSPQLDWWHLSVRLAPPKEPQAEVPAESRLVDALFGRAGLGLWNTCGGAFGLFSIAPQPDRIQSLAAHLRAPQLGQAGDDDRTAEALLHSLRRPSAVVVFSPSVLAQLWSRALLVSEPGAVGRTGSDGEIPIVRPRSLATLSIRPQARSLSARLYIPVSELEPAWSAFRAFQLLKNPTVGPEIPPLEPAAP